MRQCDRLHKGKSRVLSGRRLVNFPPVRGDEAKRSADRTTRKKRDWRNINEAYQAQLCAKHRRDDRPRFGHGGKQGGCPDGACPDRLYRRTDRSQLLFRNSVFSRGAVCGRRNSRRGRGRRRVGGAGLAGYAGRPHQGRQRGPGNDQPVEDKRRPRSFRHRRVPCHYGHHGTGQDAEPQSDVGRCDHRSGQISECLPGRGTHRAMGRGGSLLRHAGSEIQEHRGDRRQWRVWHHRRGADGRGPEGERHPGRLPGPGRSQPARSPGPTCCGRGTAAPPR